MAVLSELKLNFHIHKSINNMTKMTEDEPNSSSRCFCIECSSFYWKDLNAKSATMLLSSLPVGSFLVRPSQHPAYKYTFSQKEPNNRVSHIRIGRDESGRYLMETDEAASNLPIIRFTCVVNMIKCWCRIYRDLGDRWQLTPVPNATARQTSVYVNEETGGVCFHEDEDAELSFYNFCTDLVSQKS